LAAIGFEFLLAACGDDNVGGGSGGGQAGNGGGQAGNGGGGGSVDANPNVPPDGSTAFMDGGAWICPDPFGQQLTCQCSDGIDNDNDGLIDYPNDPDCPGPWGTSESGAGCGQTQCTDCIDNDNDGLIDSADPECTGPLDNDESSFATGIPGDNRDLCKQDCFFDGNSGQGDDRCEFDIGCDPALHSVAPYDRCQVPNSCPAQTQFCIDYCGRLTPNGCDCKGCCTVFVNGVGHDVLLVATCDVAHITDPSRCPTCTKDTGCVNNCDPCEWCLGRPPLMSCTVDGGTGGSGGSGGSDGGPPPPPTCPGNETPCDPIDRNCPVGFYCLTGCCIPNVQ
jgi:hypothetical protein